MQYDFHTIMNRHGKDALAVDHPPLGQYTKPAFSQIPMWIADMNFATVPSVPKALAERSQHPVYGYFDISPAYYEAIIRWQREMNHVHVKQEEIGYENGVLGGVASALRALCTPGDEILIHTPTYCGFVHVLQEGGYREVLSPLKKDAQGIWRMDYADMEKKLKEHHIHVTIFCSPHNPSGRVFEKEEIMQAMLLFEKYQVTVIADEIWSDLLLDHHVHIPLQSVSDYARNNTIAFYAPSKTFNLAGLIGSYHIVYNPRLQDRLQRSAAVTHYNHMNVLSMHALIAAYSPMGQDWLSQLKKVLSENVAYAYDYIQTYFADVTCARPQGTYMLFLDCSQWCAHHHCTLDDLLKKGAEIGVMWQDGRPFHGENCIRMNLALPKELVIEALNRLHDHIFRD